MVRKGPSTNLGLVEGGSTKYTCPLYSLVGLKPWRARHASVTGELTSAEALKEALETMGHIAQNQPEVGSKPVLERARTIKSL